ncbi:hypothetical protein ASD70_14935 [Pseudomonas sp. Root569]|nr:hypothetical protein ASD70_14935 [Pseudomonas sp. Root569]
MRYFKSVSHSFQILLPITKKPINILLICIFLRLISALRRHIANKIFYFSGKIKILVNQLNRSKRINDMTLILIQLFKRNEQKFLFRRKSKRFFFLLREQIHLPFNFPNINFTQTNQINFQWFDGSVRHIKIGKLYNKPPIHQPSLITPQYISPT